MDMFRTKAVFFDVGNTLIYAHPSVHEIYSNVTKEFGANVKPEQFEEQVIPIFHEFAGKLHTRPLCDDPSEKLLWHDITSEIQKRIPELHSVKFQPWFERLYHVFGTKEAWRLFDDVMPTLAKLKAKNYICGVISNWDTRLRNILNEHLLDSIFDYIFISAEVGYRKPDPRIFEASLSESGHSPQEVLYIGDQYETDIAPSVQLGMKSLLISRKGTDHKDIKTIKSLEQIFDELD